MAKLGIPNSFEAELQLHYSGQQLWVTWHQKKNIGMSGMTNLVITRDFFDFLCQREVTMGLPWEPTTFIFRGYNPYIGGSKPSFFMVLGSKGTYSYSTNG